MAKNQQSVQNTIEFVENLKKRWMSTVDAIIDPLLIIDKDYRITQANKALALHSKIEIKEIIGKKCFKIFSNQDEPCQGCEVHKTFQEAKARQFDLVKVLKNRFHEVSSQPLFDSNGKIEGVLQIYRDRTHAKQMEQKLLQTEKLASIGLLAGGIAHEVNNPLGGVILFSQLLLRDLEEGSDLHEYAQEIESAGKRCRTIVENLLNFARQQPTESQHQTIDLIPCLKSALKFGTVGNEVSTIEITESYDLKDIKILGNRTKMIQLFLNLIQNSIHAMPKGGHLLLKSYMESSDQDRWAVIEVSDTGVGIPPEELPRIFDPFYTSKPEGEGTGLGLSICHGIAEEMSLTIEVQSEVDRGTCFLVKAQLP